MIAKLNFFAYVVLSLLSVVFYVKSVSPAQLEKKIGPTAYERCAKYRLVSGIAMSIALINFILCRSYPITRCLPMRFYWPAWLLMVLAVLIGLPAISLVVIGIQDAGAETMAPRREHQLYSRGIYTHIRHPQAYEALLWPALALGLNSPLLLVLSLPWLLLEYIMVMAEEFDLVIRFGDPYLAYHAATPPFIPRELQLRSLIEKIKDSLHEE